jgi:uncharacterized protein (TIGR03437 family)
MHTLPVRSSILLFALFGVCAAGAAIYYPSPEQITVGAPTVSVDILRIPLEGEVGGYDEPEFDTFEWYGPGVSLLSGQPVKLARPTLIRGDVVRVQLDASLLRTPGIGYIVYTVDPTGRRERQFIGINVTPPPRIDGALTAGSVNTRMAQTLEAVNGSAPYQWSISSGSLPTGIVLVGRAQSADFVGIPTAAGSYTFTVRVVDRYQISAEKSFTLLIAGPPVRISTTELPSGVVGIPYAVQLQAAGGTAPFQWSSAASLPPGLSLSASGALAGTPTAAGTYSIAVSVKDAAGSDQKTFSLAIDAAFLSFQAASGEAGVAAPESIVAGYGVGLPTAVVSVVIRDSGGQESAARLYFASPGQINYVVPAGTRTGAAVVTVRSAGAMAAVGTLQIQTVAPGIFTMSADGKGTPAGYYLRVGADQSRTNGPLSEAIDLGAPSDSVYLLLVGTGIRNRSSLEAATATVGGESVPVTFAGPQTEYPGLDQINLGPLPRTLAGRGTVTVQLKVDGKNANPVTVAIR